MDLRRAIRADGPLRIEGMTARWAEVLQARVAVRTKHVIRLDGIPAMRAFAELHELAALERDLEILFVAIFSRELRTRDAPDDESDEGNERDDSPQLPSCSAMTRVFDNVSDREKIEKGHDRNDDGHERVDGCVHGLKHSLSFLCLNATSPLIVREVSQDDR